MRDALKYILEGFDDDRHKAWDQIVPIVIVCCLLLAFMLWYAVPVPSVDPQYSQRPAPVIAKAEKAALGK